MPQLDLVSLVNSGGIFLIFLTLNSNYFFIMPLYLLFTYFNFNFRKIKNNFLKTLAKFRKLNNFLIILLIT